MFLLVVYISNILQENKNACEKKTQINYYFQINYKCKFQIHCFYNGLNGLGTLYRDYHAHLFVSKEAILNEALKMFISSETKAAIGQGQRSCSDFPCSIHFHCISRSACTEPKYAKNKTKADMSFEHVKYRNLICIMYTFPGSYQYFAMQIFSSEYYHNSNFTGHWF